MEYFTPSCDCVLTLNKDELTSLIFNGWVTLQPARVTCAHKEFKGENREFDVAGMTVCEYVGDEESIKNHYIQFLQIRLGRDGEDGEE